MSNDSISGIYAQADNGPSLWQQIRSWLGLSAARSDNSLKEAIEEVLEEHTEEQADSSAKEETRIIKNVLSFGGITVGDIMISRAGIVAVEDTVNLQELKRMIVEQRHTRLPVYHETLDDIKGFIHVKDVVEMISGDVPFTLKNIVRQILFVPPSMRVADLLLKMRLSGAHMAIVVDEFGGTDGLVTMENVFEEIVGEIQDEHDEAEQHQNIHWVDDETLEADGLLDISTLEETLGVSFAEEEDEGQFDTLGGLVFFLLGRVPAKGEIVDHSSGLRIEVLDADPRRIRRLRIIKPPAPVPAAETA